MKPKLPETQVSKHSLAAQIRTILIERILQGGFEPGERLVEMRLAEEMGTSQAPVREALRELSTLGVVEYTKNRGTRVRVPDNQELGEIYDVRAEIEGYAASLAAKHFADNIDALSVHVEQMNKAAANNDILGVANANTLFHRTIVAASGNNTLLGVWDQLDVRSRTTMNFIRKKQDLDAIARSHVEIVEALSTGRAKTARKVSRDHVLKFKPDSEAPSPVPADGSAKIVKQD